MGQANRHRAEIFRKSGGMCIYCGGGTAATTVDHMPPRSMFDRKDRPAGLEFASCEACNRGARLADLVCALLGRIFPDAQEPDALEEVNNYLRAVKNNVPGLLEEMAVPAAREKHELKRLGLSRDQGGLLRVGGPIALRHLEVFGARLGMAMHFEQTGHIIPAEGGVYVRIYSNVDLAEGKIPDTIFDILPQPRTLAQGKKNVEQQFSYGVRATDDERMTMSFASFRLSFAALSFASMNLGAFRSGDDLPPEAVPFRPGALQLVLPPSYSAGAVFRSGR
jgi:hypothetical protein